MTEPTQLNKLQRKRKTQRSKVSRFSNQINNFDDSTETDEIEHNLDRLQESFQSLNILDESIQDLLDNTEYETDVTACEEYLETAKRAIRKGNKLISTRNAKHDSHEASPQTVQPTQLRTTTEIKLPTLHLESFTGDIEAWPRFWEQFQASIDKNPAVSPINKHVFLRGYLNGEPKHLVDGIAVTADTYEQTKQILQSRYGNNNRIIQSHLDYLEHLPPAISDHPEVLNSTYIECHRRIQALTALGENANMYGRILAPKILRAFPDDLCRRWLTHAKRLNLEENNISKLMEFLNEEVESALNTLKIRGDYSSSVASHIPTAANFHVDTRQSKSKGKRQFEPFCVFCENRGHWGQECRKITNCNERIEKLKNTNRCFLCLKRGHNSRQCAKRGKAQCTKCKKQHHVSICGDGDSLCTSVGKIEVKIPHFTYLQTARIWIIGPTGRRILTRCILDAGSQSSFVNSSLIESLQLKVTESRNLQVITFESFTSASKSRRQVLLDIQGFSTKATLTLTAFESNHTYSHHPAVPQDIRAAASTGKLKLADPKDDSHELPIEILIGADHYWKIVKLEQPKRITDSLTLLPSIFGWILTGSRSGTTVNQTATLHISLKDELSDESMRRFWNLETIGIRETRVRELHDKDAEILRNFHATYRVQDGRRVVSLPRRNEVILSNNFQTAEKRFQSLEGRFNRDADFKTMYHTHMLDYIVKKQVEIAPDSNTVGNTFYLPHHAVKKHTRDVTKWRIVFDASSHEPDFPALNDALEMGPNLLPEILATLLRFRMHRKAIVCDGSQAFLQLSLDENDRDLTRFLWYRVNISEDGVHQTTNDVIAYRFTRLPFGLKSSPFLLSATLRELPTLHQENYPTATSLLDKSTFMDDFAASVEDDNITTAVYYELTALLRQINLPLSKWVTNSQSLMGIWKAEGREIKLKTRVLGVDWNAESDVLFATPEDITRELLDKPGTKRQLLRITARFYDPLGLFAPSLIVGKILFQDTWCRGLQWEEILPADLAQRWQKWISNLKHLSSIHIPRWIGVSTHSDISIHVFCDASERAFGAVLYLRSANITSCTVRLICSKNRLSPLKKVTLPRLELLAALIGSRLLHYFCQETGFDSSRVTLWSDSTVTLGWIRSNPNRWKTFVCNRITEIHTHTTSSQWRHCPGINNPADYLSRGLKTEELAPLTSWWNGPDWLSKHPDSWPRDITIPTQTLPEEKKISQIYVATIQEPLFDASRFSSYWKLLHVTAWIFRFVQCMKEKRKHLDGLTAAELETSKMYWLRQVQEQCFASELTALKNGLPLSKTSNILRFNPFLQDGLIRLGGRLQFADLSNNERHPMLLDGNHHFTQLLIMLTHIRLHHLGVRIVLTELRGEYWILRARQTIKKVLHTCLPCKIAHNRRAEEIEAPLPLDRVRPIRPFAVTGIDFAGPLYVKACHGVKKSYIVLFTCATTRAVHLELATDMSTDRFLMALQRFASRRGLPQTVYSDNAPTFYAANRELAELLTTIEDPKLHHYFAHHGIVWKFIAPRAAWWGGWWERMIGSTKRCLRKVLGRSQQDEEGLNTILASIEAALNSRPITEEVGTEEILTPAHFLLGSKLTLIPHGPEPNIKVNLAKEFKLKQKATADFWQRWKREYLLQLKSYHEVKGQRKQQRALKVGDIVILQEDMKPRQMWKMARIEELRPGRDQRIRTVILRQPDGNTITRPIQLVIPLEIDQGGEDVTVPKERLLS